MGISFLEVLTVIKRKKWKKPEKYSDFIWYCPQTNKIIWNSSKLSPDFL
jgi:hypothetical protein